MNSNELLKVIQRRLVESGISNMVAEFVREHPEYWDQNDSYTGAGYNTSCIIDIAFNTVSNINAYDMTQATPFYTLSIGRAQSKNVDMSIHPNNNSSWTDYWYKGKIQLSHRGNLNG